MALAPLHYLHHFDSEDNLPNQRRAAQTQEHSRSKEISFSCPGKANSFYFPSSNIFTENDTTKTTHKRAHVTEKAGTQKVEFFWQRFSNSQKNTAAARPATLKNSRGSNFEVKKISNFHINLYHVVLNFSHVFQSLFTWPKN